MYSGTLNISQKAEDDRYDKRSFDGKRWAALWKAVPDYYVPGFIMTLKISAAGLLTALILGVIFGTFSTMKFKPAKILSRIYVEFIQNTPLALQVLFYYSVLPLLFPTPVSVFLNLFLV